METLLTILTIVFIPLYGLFMFRMGRKLEQDKLQIVINKIKEFEENFKNEKRNEETNR